VLRGDHSGWDFAMRDTRGWSDIVFQVSVAIIVMELLLLSIGLNLTAGVEPAMFAAP
jgi:hypothetical protein